MWTMNSGCESLLKGLEEQGSNIMLRVDPLAYLIFQAKNGGVRSDLFHFVMEESRVKIPLGEPCFTGGMAPSFLSEEE